MEGKQRNILKGVVLLVIASVVCFSSVAQAALKDIDVDGLTDESEASIYKTNPKLYDTDGDSVGDGQEVLDATNPLDAESSKLLLLSNQEVGLLGPVAQRPWYIARASGLLAFMLLSLGAIYGLVISSRALSRVITSPVAYELHRTLSLVSLGVVLLHISSFFFDDYLKIRFFEAFVPGVLQRNFPSALGYNLGFSVGMGIVAFYIILILILTSEFRAKLSSRVWRKIHYLSFVAYLLFVGHGFTAGTDSGEYWVRVMYIVSLMMVGVLVSIRIISRGIIPAWKARNTRPSSDGMSSDASPKS